MPLFRFKVNVLLYGSHNFFFVLDNIFAYIMLFMVVFFLA